MSESNVSAMNFLISEPMSSTTTRLHSKNGQSGESRVSKPPFCLLAKQDVEIGVTELI